MFVDVVLDVPLDATFTYFVPQSLKNKEYIDFGIRVKVPFGNNIKTGFVVSLNEEKPEKEMTIKEVKEVIDKEKVFNKELLELSKWMSYMYFSSIGQNLSMMVPTGKREVENTLFFNPASFKKIEKLSEEQEKALKVLKDKESGLFYLFGVTGSGKSEVFLRKAEEVIEKGGQVLYLVPEITLSLQLTNQIYERFNGRVAIFHSSLTPSQRLKAWKDAGEGNVDIILGARSSVFAPFKNLKLIILDEEHDTSYKSEFSPRYNARQIAQKRASVNNALLLMGSATPSLEAWKMMRENKMRMIALEKRIGLGSFPKIKIVNILGEKRNISVPLEEKIRETISSGHQVILFLNRRGYTYSYVCNSCGNIIECPDCSVSLTYHKRENILKCHTCGHEEKPLRYCPNCLSYDIAPKGFGTENVEEELKILFPNLKIARLDTDITKGEKKITEKIIADFRDGKIDILLGTQMISKGLNFPNASLVGILNADSTLSISDFRAQERTFQLLHQVSGRVGRFRPDGVVMVQTSQPLNIAINAVVTNNLYDYYESEMGERRSVNFPPFSRLLDITLRSKDENKVRLEIKELEKKALELLKNFKALTVFTASPSLIYKKHGQFRYHLLFLSENIKTLLSFTHTLIDNYKTPNHIKMEVDPDPVSLL